MLTIAQRLAPFTHEAGKLFFLPGTNASFCIYPTRLEVMISKEVKGVLHFKLTGLITDFTALLDIAREKIIVFGRSEEGYFRYHIYFDKGIVFYADKTPENGLKFVFEERPVSTDITLRAKDTMILAANLENYLPRITERLSFGSHKKQDWEGIKKRAKAEEFLPFWFLLGQHAGASSTEETGFFHLLKKGEKLLAAGDKEGALQELYKVFIAGFDGVFYPRNFDTTYQGVLDINSLQEEDYSQLILKSGYQLIRSFFYQKNGDEIFILPELPQVFHCGRLLGIEEENIAIHFEWSKRQIRLIEMHSKIDQKIHLKLQSQIRSFRIREKGKGLGRKLQSQESLILKADTFYLLDRFEK